MHPLTLMQFRVLVGLMSISPVIGCVVGLKHRDWQPFTFTPIANLETPTQQACLLIVG